MQKVKVVEDYVNATSYGTFDEGEGYIQPGITTRMWLTGLAMQSIMTGTDPMLTPEETAPLAKQYADAILQDET